MSVGTQDHTARMIEIVGNIIMLLSQNLFIYKDCVWFSYTKVLIVWYILPTRAQSSTIVTSPYIPYVKLVSRVVKGKIAHS